MRRSETTTSSRSGNGAVEGEPRLSPGEPLLYTGPAQGKAAVTAVNEPEMPVVQGKSVPPADPLADLTDDLFLGDRLRVLQPRRGQRAGSDAVLLAACAPVVSGRAARVLDVGAGCGIVALAIAHHVADCVLTGVEIEPALVALARENAARNGFAERVRFVEADVLARPSEIAAVGVEPDSFDHVVSNPPFHPAEVTRLSPDGLRARARHIHAGDLEAWIAFLARSLRGGGTATMIYRADALAQVLELVSARFGGITVFPIFPRAGASASRVIINAVRGSRAPLTMRPGLVMHEADNSFSAAANALQRQGVRLDILDAAATPHRRHPR